MRLFFDRWRYKLWLVLELAWPGANMRQVTKALMMCRRDNFCNVMYCECSATTAIVRTSKTYGDVWVNRASPATTRANFSNEPINSKYPQYK